MSPTRYSHPRSEEHEAVELADHLENVAERAEAIVTKPPDNGGVGLSSLVSTLGWVHDFGKLTTWFQTHIDPERGEPSGPSTHSPLGAVVAHHCVDALGGTGDEALAGYVAVAKHHGRLPDVGDYVYGQTLKPRDGERRRADIRRQVENIDEHAPELAGEILAKATEGRVEWDEFATSIREGDSFRRIAYRLEGVELIGGPTEAPVSPSFYSLVLQAWSTLIFADKTSAAQVPTNRVTHTIPPRSRIQARVEELQGAADAEASPNRSELDELRKAAHQEVLKNVDQLATDESAVATITLPTGLGKTLTGLDAAFGLRDRTDRKRVVYALPFTTIIDQVSDEVGDIFDADGTDDTLTIHHHLSDTVVENDDEETDADAGLAAMLGESWRSGVTVTTFVQLFESLAGPKNTQSMKLPALRDSVVVLDEPQSLPHDWWPAVRRLVDILATEYNTSIIAMTATQPRLFTDQSVELVPDPAEYYGKLDRVAFSLDESINAFSDEVGTVEYEAAAVRLREVCADGSVLAICNTIESARELTAAVRDCGGVVDVGERYGETLRSAGAPEDVDISALVQTFEELTDDDQPVSLHLTTRIRPADRLRLVELAKRLTEHDVPFVAVTTQLIEAGVDISFEQVFRDLAPMDSVVQAAGRCNRSFERDQGRVTIWWLDAPGESQLTPAEAVYNRWGNSLVSQTIQALETVRGGETVLDEPTVAWEGVREYYRRLADLDPGRTDLVKFVDAAQAAKLGQASLIEQREAIEVIVARTEQDRILVEELRSAWERGEFAETDALLDGARPLQVSIPIYDRDSEIVETFSALPRLHPGSESGLFVVDVEQDRYNSFFDDTTGVLLPDSTAGARFL